MGELKLEKIAARHRRHLRIRQKVAGTSERPRLCVHRSLKHIYAQIIDDTTGRVLASASSLSADTRKSGAAGKNVASAASELHSEKRMRCPKRSEKGSKKQRNRW
ncbi:MAG: 50S ribosomal protein L18 [Candidatus Lindowbacteria bacterium]|nr:50S ribosomal protein L18 [Candidatus Lindowbacteria bacterium]